MATNRRFWVRALFDFNGTEQGDLQFKEGDCILIIRSANDSDWWEGMTTTGNRGLIPSNYVEKVTSRKFSTAVQDLFIPEMEIYVPTKHSNTFEILLQKKIGSQQIFKDKNDIEMFHQQLIQMLPSIDFSENIAIDDEDILFQSKNSITESAPSLQRYFSAVLKFPTLSVLLNSWLNPGERTTLMTEDQEEMPPRQLNANIDVVADDFEEYVVKYDWKPEQPDDLELIEGEIIEVLSQPEHGWWYGRRKNGHVGDFPSNYVEKKQNDDQKQETKQNLKLIQNEMKDQPKKVRPHTIRSLDAFDQLMNKGFAVEILENSTNQTNDKLRIDNGTTVQIHCCGMIWDGSQHCTNQFVSTHDDNELLSFTIGKNQVVTGLEEGLKGLCEGQSVRITCTPSTAYGDAGLPPFIPPHSNVVFEVEIVTVQHSFSELSLSPVGPQILLRKGISSNRNSGVAFHQARPRSVLLEKNDVRNTGLNITDEMIAKSCAAMSLSTLTERESEC